MPSEKCNLIICNVRIFCDTNSIQQINIFYVLAKISITVTTDLPSDWVNSSIESHSHK